MADTGDPLIDIVGYKDILSSGTLLPRRSKFNIVGGSASDNPLLDATDINVASQADWKDSVRVATTGVLPASTRVDNVLTADAVGAFPSVDGISLAVTESLLLKNEVTGANNGVWVVTNLGGGSTSWVLTRRSDFDSDAEVTSMATIPVSEGTVNGLLNFQLVTPDPIVINTTSLSFATFIGVSDWESVLAVGATSGATDPIIDSGQSILGAAAATGGDLPLVGGAGSAGPGGAASLTGGAAGGGGSDGGKSTVAGGAGSGTGDGGPVFIQSGIAGGGGGSKSGAVIIQSVNAPDAGTVSLFAGNSTVGGGAPTEVQGGDSDAGGGGPGKLTGGDGLTAGGNVELTSGTASGGLAGNLVMTTGAGTTGQGVGEFIWNLDSTEFMKAGSFATGATHGGGVGVFFDNDLGGTPTVIGWEDGAGTGNDLFVTAQTSTDNVGGKLSLFGGDGAGGSDGGEAALQGGDGDTGGAASLQAGSTSGVGNNGGGVNIDATIGNGSGAGGAIKATAGNGGLTGAGGEVDSTAGSGGATSGNGANAKLTSGSSTVGTAGDVVLTSGTSASGAGGNVSLVLGTGTTQDGVIKLAGSSVTAESILGALTTVNATPATIATFSTTTDNSTILMELRLTARDVTSGDRASFVIAIELERNGASVVVELDRDFIHVNKADATWDVTTNISAQDIQIQVTGDATNNTSWHLVGSVMENS